MQYIEQQLTEFRAEFAKRRRRQLLATVPIVAGIVLVRVLSKKEEADLFFGLPASVVMGAAFAVVVAVVAFTLWNWRCPACSKYLGKGINPAFCSKCGVALR